LIHFYGDLASPEAKQIIMYFKLIGDRVIYLVLYVDDMLLVGNDKDIIQDFKTQLSSKFDMKYLGAANYILGMGIKRDWEKRKL